jgi:hypothetical protein
MGLDDPFLGDLQPSQGNLACLSLDLTSPSPLYPWVILPIPVALSNCLYQMYIFKLDLSPKFQTPANLHLNV